MMYFLIWAIVGFLSYFFLYKKHEVEIKCESGSMYDNGDTITWILALSLFWPISAPGYIAFKILKFILIKGWAQLEKFNNKYFNVGK